MASGHLSADSGVFALVHVDHDGSWLEIPITEVSVDDEDRDVNLLQDDADGATGLSAQYLLACLQTLMPEWAAREVFARSETESDDGWVHALDVAIGGTAVSRDGRFGVIPRFDGADDLLT